MLPSVLRPTDLLVVPSALGELIIPLCRPQYTKAIATEGVHSFGGKDLLLVDDRPQFAEDAILRVFEADGWQGRWLETYPYRKNPRLWREWNMAGPRAQVHMPITETWVNEKLKAIAAANNNSFSGCWDVVAWKEERLVFAESKKQKKDRMRGTQLRWLEAGLKCGCAVEDFLVVEWVVD